MKWTSLLPRRPFDRSATIDVTDDDEVAAGPAVAAGSAVRQRTTVGDFAKRAAAEAVRLETTAVEVRTERAMYEPLFPAERYATVPTDTVAPTIGCYPGFDPGLAMDELAADDGRYGIALCVGALERNPEPLALMLELSRILEPGGQLFLVAPLIVPEPDRHVTPSIFAPANRRRYGLNYLLDASGFSIEYLDPVERSSAYAVIGRKPCGARNARRSTDRTDP